MVSARRATSRASSTRLMNRKPALRCGLFIAGRSSTHVFGGICVGGATACKKRRCAWPHSGAPPPHRCVICALVHRLYAARAACTACARSRSGALREWCMAIMRRARARGRLPAVCGRRSAARAARRAVPVFARRRWPWRRSRAARKNRLERKGGCAQGGHIRRTTGDFRAGTRSRRFLSSTTTHQSLGCLHFRLACGGFGRDETRA